MGEKKRRAKQGQQRQPWQERFTVSDGFSAEEVIELRRQAERAMLELNRLDDATAHQVIVDQFQLAGVVYGVWPNEDAPGGNRVAILRGMGRLREIAQGKHSARERVFRLLCTDYLDAELHWRALGDGRQDPSPPTVADLPNAQLMMLPYMPLEDRIEQVGLGQQNLEVFRSIPEDQGISWIKEAFGADIVFGVFAPNKDRDVKNAQVAVLKGAAVFRSPYVSAEPVTASQVTILCPSWGYTQMLCCVLGDGRREGWSDLLDLSDNKPLQDDLPRAVRYDVELAPAPDEFMPWLPKHDRFEISAPVPSARTNASSSR